jgi:hypothetical protein
MTVQDSSRLGLRRDNEEIICKWILDIDMVAHSSPSTVVYIPFIGISTPELPGIVNVYIYIYMTWLLFRLFVRRDGRSEIYKVPSPILATKKLSLKELTYLLPRTIYHFYPAHNEGSRLRPPRERTFATTFSSRLRKRLSKMPTRRRCLVANKWWTSPWIHIDVDV